MLTLMHKSPVHVGDSWTFPFTAISRRHYAPSSRWGYGRRTLRSAFNLTKAYHKFFALCSTSGDSLFIAVLFITWSKLLRTA